MPRRAVAGSGRCVSKKRVDDVEALVALRRVHRILDAKLNVAHAGAVSFGARNLELRLIQIDTNDRALGHESGKRDTHVAAATPDIEAAGTRFQSHAVEQRVSRGPHHPAEHTKPLASLQAAPNHIVRRRRHRTLPTVMRRWLSMVLRPLQNDWHPAAHQGDIDAFHICIAVPVDRPSYSTNAGSWSMAEATKVQYALAGGYRRSREDTPLLGFVTKNVGTTKPPASKSSQSTTDTMHA